MDSYKKIMDRVQAPEELIENVLDEKREQEYWQKERQEDRKKGMLRFASGTFRFAVGAFVLCFCFLFSMKVVAGSVPEVYQWMYLLSPDTAQYFKPVKEVSENNGIKMEVVSAYIHDNVAEIYITMEDLEGDRIDKTIDLYDSYSIHKPFSATGHCSLVGYDEETGKATFLISVTQWDDQKIAGKKMTFSVREFISHKKEYDLLPVVVDFSKADKEPELVKTWINGLGRGISVSESDDVSRNDVKVLKPGKGESIELIGEGGESILIEGVEISGLAYADGCLHVQKRTENIFQNDNHGYFLLEDENGNIIDYWYHVSFQEKENGSYTEYEEFVFKVSEEKLAKCKLVAYLCISGTYVEGPWQVTFPLENIEE